MALSNWDTLAFNDLCKSCVGQLKLEGGTLEIYKNWLHIAFGEDEGRLVVSINEGNVSINSTEIWAKRGPQNSVMFVVRYGPWDDEGFFGGIGCSGYKSAEDKVREFLGREPEEWEDWCDGGTISEERNTEELTCLDSRTGKCTEHIYWDEAKDGKYDYSKDWLGVKPETLKHFFDWLAGFEQERIQKWAYKCAKAEALRYNQGDAFFAGALDAEAIPATEVGNPGPTILGQILGDMNDENLRDNKEEH